MADNELGDELNFDEAGLNELLGLNSTEEGGDPQSTDENWTGTPPVEGDNNSDETEKSVTQIVSARIKQERQKIEQELLQREAERNGFATYDEMVKSNERSKLEEKGYDADELAPIIEELVKKRLEDSPEMREVREYKETKKNEWANGELKSLNEKYGLAIKSLAELDKDTLDLWEKTGDLKKAYVANHYEDVVKAQRTATQMRQAQQSVSHVALPKGSGTTSAGTMRFLNEDEKDVYRSLGFSEEEIAKETKLN